MGRQRCVVLVSIIIDARDDLFTILVILATILSICPDLRNTKHPLQSRHLQRVLNQYELLQCFQVPLCVHSGSIKRFKENLCEFFAHLEIVFAPVGDLRFKLWTVIVLLDRFPYKRSFRHQLADLRLFLILLDQVSLSQSCADDLLEW